jgi:PIN domain
MVFHNPMDDRQPQARALPHHFRGEKRFEYPLEHVGRDASPAIAHGQPDIRPNAEGGMGRLQRGVHLDGLQADPEEPTHVAHGILGVRAEVHQRDRSEAQAHMDLMAALPGLRVDSTEALGLIAGDLKAQHRMSVVDAWIAALAHERNATLVHKDPEFEQVEATLKVLKLPYKVGS